MPHRAVGVLAGRLSLLLPALALAAGCGGDGLERQPISGTVTFDGEPLETGQIQFFPDQSNEVAIMGGAPIEDGGYSIPRDQGLVPGKYVVRISAASGEEQAVEGEDDELMPGLGPIHAPELIPAKYNTETTLAAEVTSDGRNTFDYTLEK